MNRDKAIEIAAQSLAAWSHKTNPEWAANVMNRADALLAEMGEADAVEYCDGTCCRATEARVVAEIASYLDGWHMTTAEAVRRGDWRAKEPVR